MVTIHEHFAYSESVDEILETSNFSNCLGDFNIHLLRS
jgi:hypothetical protein